MATPTSSGLATFLQNELTTLATEAKKKHLDVKEASERLQLILKQVKERAPSPSPSLDYTATGTTPDQNLSLYVQNTYSLTLELAKTDDVLTPFLLACESKNPKLVSIAISCINRLVNHQAIPESSVNLILKTLSEYVNGPMELQLKILQTILPLLTHFKNAHGEVAILVCFRLQDSKAPVVSSSAAATLRQLIMYTFEKVVVEASESGNEENTQPQDTHPCANDAYLLFQDLCQLTNGESASSLKIGTMSKNLGLELLESVLSNHWRLFKTHERLLVLLKEHLCPIVIKSFSDKNDYALSVRLMRIIHIIVKHFSNDLMMECEIFLSMFVKLLEADGGPLWQRVLVVEVIKNLFATDAMVRTLFNAYDSKEHSTKVLSEVIHGVASIIVSEKPALLLPPQNTAGETQVSPSSAASFPELYALTTQNSSIKMPCLDQLDKTEAPAFTETYLVYLAIQCIISVAEGEAAYIIPLFNIPKDAANNDVGGFEGHAREEVLLAIDLAKTTWAYILASLSLLCIASIDDDIFTSVVHAYENFTTAIGLLGLTSFRDALLGSLSRICVPGGSSLSADGMMAYKEVNQLSVTAGQLFLNRIMHSGTFLGDRHASCLKALISTTSRLTDILDAQAWYTILETLQVADGLVSSGKMGRRDASSGSLLKDDAKDSTKLKVTTSNLATTGAAQPLDNQFLNLLALIRRLFESMKSMPNRCFREAVFALCKLAKESTLGVTLVTSSAPPGPSAQRTDSKVADEKSFAISRIHDVCVINAERLVGPSIDVWDVIISNLLEIAHAPNVSVNIRSQVCQTLSEVVLTSIQSVDFKTSEIPSLEMKLLEPIKRLMLVDIMAANSTVDENERVVRGSWFFDVQKFGLETLNKVLQRSGQHLVQGWGLIFDVVRSAVLGTRKRGELQTSTVNNLSSAVDGSSSSDVQGGSSSKSAALVRVGFPSLQLICSDFLSMLEPNMLYECMDTLACFGSQMDDINISLTAIGLLWSVSDFVLTKRQELERQGKISSASTPSINEDSRPPESSDDSSRPNLKVIVASHENLSGPTTTKTMDALWMYLLGHLSQLCSDPRPEVRNSANQTLFRTIGMNGKRLTLDAWDECIWNVLFPLLERVKISSERVELVGRLNLSVSKELLDAHSTPTGSRPSSGLPLHHSRNSSSKQWDETKVLTLSGVGGSFVNFLPILVELGSGFDRAWSLLHDYIKAWCLGGSPEVAVAAIKCLRSLVRYHKDLPSSSDGTPSKVQANVQARMIELWKISWEVWESIGLGIIAGTDENGFGSAGSADSLSSIENSSRTDRLLHGSFTQDALTAYVNLFPDIYEVISTVFGLPEMRRLITILTTLPLYHTNPPPGATITKLRVDMIPDTDSLTPLQESIMGILFGTKVDLSNIRGAPELIMSSISRFIYYPFIKMRNLNGSATGLNASDSKGDGSTRTFSYMALSKKSIQSLVGLFELHGGLSTVYSGGTFEAILSALSTPMTAKYECPPPGNKDTTPLWRAAANTAMTIIEMGLKRLDVFVADLPQTILNSIYTKILEMFEGFLVSSSSPPVNLSADELSVDTDFDISIFETYQNDVIIHMGQQHVPDHLIRGMIDIISSGNPADDPNLETTTLSKATSMVCTNPHQSSFDITAVSGGTVLGGDVIVVKREKFAKHCLECLMNLCSAEIEGLQRLQRQFSWQELDMYFSAMHQTAHHLVVFLFQ
ncbi:hypothetical protein HDV05_008075, partial [Chytridiales sp. JEL 0842]